MNNVLSRFMVQRIERAIAEGKPVEAGLRAQFEAQTGQKVSAPADTTPAPILPFDSTDELPGKDSSSRRIIQRSIKDGPFCWQSKTALRRIREVAGESNRPSAASVVAVYMALSELASDHQAESFEAHRGHIAGKSCLDVRTVDKVMPILEAAGLLRIERRKLEATLNLPSIYTLLSYGKEIKSPPSDIKPPVAKRCENEAVTPILKNPTEKSKEDRRPAARMPSLEQWMEYTAIKYPDWPADDAQGAWEHYESVGWMKRKTPILQWKSCTGTCYRNFKSNQRGSRQEEPVRLGVNLAT